MLNYWIVLFSRYSLGAYPGLIDVKDGIELLNMSPRKILKIIYIGIRDLCLSWLYERLSSMLYVLSRIDDPALRGILMTMWL